MLILWTAYMCIATTAFRIPLLFGGIDIQKGENGKVAVGMDQNANFFGFGGNQNTTLTFVNGTFDVNSTSNALVNNTNFGGGGAIGLDKETGVVLDNQVNFNNKTVQGGLGKESSFFTDLFSAFNDLKTRK